MNLISLKQQRIGVLSGGLSSEREVSIRSGKNIHEALKRLGYNSFIIDVDRMIATKLRDVDIAFIALHGRYGEDGCIQGLLGLMGIPYTGPGVMASAIGMNKVLTKKIVAASNFPYPSFVELNSNKISQNLMEIENKIGFPFILKPCEEGSSIGVELIKNKNQFESMIVEYLKKYPVSMAEKYIKGREITVGILNTKQDMTVFPILELKSKNEFYDYQAKYTKGMTDFILPSEVSAKTKDMIVQISELLCRNLEIKGIVRIDFIIDQDEIPMILEINTIPGMTETSDIPAMAQAMGMSFDELVDKILKIAVNYD